MKDSFVLELGFEELPARHCLSILKQLNEDTLKEILTKNNLSFSGPHLHLTVDPHLPLVAGGEELGAQFRGQEQRAAEQPHRQQQGEEGVAQGEQQQVAVAVLQGHQTGSPLAWGRGLIVSALDVSFVGWVSEA